VRIGRSFGAGVRSERLVLPSPGARAAFERADDLGRDPAAVEPAGLRLRALVADVACVHGSDVEGDVGLDRAERRGGALVAPSDFLSGAAVHSHCPVGCVSFPLAEGAPLRFLHEFHLDVLLRNVVHCMRSAIREFQRLTSIC
jgi:hypothetical protein